jgi:hypothetical protein
MERKETSKMALSFACIPLMSSKFINLLKLCSFILLLFTFYNVSAQRAERRSIFDTYYSSGDRDELFDHLAAWITCNEGILAYYGDKSGHLQLDETLLPYHRALIRQIENYLMKQPGGDKFVPLPGWIPNADASYSIPTPFTKDYKGNVVLSSSASASSSAFDPDLYSNTNICSQGSTSIIFADNWNAQYHTPIHTLLGGDFNDPYLTTGIPLFWLFHADCDDVWYRWERECNSLYDVYPADHENPVVNINTNTVWDEDKKIKGIITIKRYATLTIEEGAIIRFRDSEYESYETKIVIEDGGTLHIDGAKLTGIEKLYSSGSSNGLYYFTSWEGVVVNRGAELIIEHGSVIENAKAAVQISGTNNDITINDSEFKDNRKSIVVRNKIDLFSISGCVFNNINALRDNVWKVSINNGTTLEVESQYDHCIPFGTENHIELVNCTSVEIESNTFTQVFNEPYDHNVSTGVFSSDSHVKITGSNVFEKLWTGVFVYNSGSGPRGIVKVDNNGFLGNKYGIHAINSDYLLAEENEFLFTNPAVSKVDEYGQGYDCETCGHHGHMAKPGFPGFAIRLSSGSSGFQIRHNQIIANGHLSNKFGVIIGGTRRGYGNLIHNNTFEDLCTGIQIDGDHDRFQMPCNTFDMNETALEGPGSMIAVDWYGFIPAQGSPRQPTGNNLGTECVGYFQLFSRNYGEEFKYYHFEDDNNILQCTTSNVFPVDVGSLLPIGYCNRITECYPLPWYECFEEALDDILSYEYSISSDPFMTSGDRLKEYNIIENDKRSLLVEGVHSGLESWDWAGVSDYIEDFSVLIPDFELDFEILEVRKDTSIVISEEVGYQEYVVDGQCVGCDVDALLEYINSGGKLPAFEVVPIDSIGYSPLQENVNTYITNLSDETRTDNVVFPNPASDVLNVELVEDIIDLTIFDLNGKSVLRLENLRAGIHTINITNFLPGMYVLKIINVNGNHIPLKLNVR